MPLPVLFFAFANSPEKPLPQLTEEDDGIKSILHRRANREEHFKIHTESHADLGNVRKYISEYSNQLWLFHYAGHANSTQLFLTSGKVKADGIAAMLSRQSSMKLVFLNGCSTYMQVRGLLDLGIPAVIATHTPIDDDIAQKFAHFFYSTLELGGNIQEAFEEASDYITSIGNPTPIIRGFEIDELGDDISDETWGLFFLNKKIDVLNERLPSGIRKELPPEFEPNQILLESIWAVFEKGGLINDKLKKQKTSRKRMHILNNLPAPVAEQLRKLLVPLDDASEGYNKVSTKRLRQLSRTYQVLMELLTFTLLAQLWEHFLNKELNLTSITAKDNIQTFLVLSEESRNSFRFVPLIRKLISEMESNQLEYFVEELVEMKKILIEEESFHQSCKYFDLLSLRLIKESDVQLNPERERLCLEAEVHLANVFAEFGYIARYTLATVKQILVQKYRHTINPSFQHLVVRLVDLLGGVEEEIENFSSYLDSQSVLLLKEDEDQGNILFLNLSPFIIDENAFIDNSDVSKIYFLNHFKAHSNSWAYKLVSKPTEPELLVPGKNFRLILEQLEAFKEKFVSA